MKKRLSHLDKGRATMVDVGAKNVTHRQATASGFVRMAPATVRLVRAQRTPKGDPLETARLAGIMAAKRTSELIPLCHPLPLTHVDVQAELKSGGVAIRSSASTNSTTGVEMEALTAAAVAALTIYDMCKAVDREMEIGAICLESKSGGRSGTYVRKASTRPAR
ncbi:MAG: cyclic pyranopterin monophosphate synthase MoaC [Acidobacteria bacterium]|nr:cyclic pyranopterin monophosphate synthase MoaC [Acidobacteriota bacterium]